MTDVIIEVVYGVISQVLADGPVRVVVVDYCTPDDPEFASRVLEEHRRRVPQLDDEPHAAFVKKHLVDQQPELVAQIVAIAEQAEVGHD